MIPSNAGDFVTALYKLSVDLLNHRQPEQVAQRLVDEVARLVRAPQTELVLYRDDMLVVEACASAEPSMKGDVLIRPEGRLAWQAFDTRQPTIIEDYSVWEHRRPEYESAQLHAVADVPILVGDRCIGVLGVGRRTANDPLTPEDIQKTIILAQLAGAAMTNAMLYADALREIEYRAEAEEALGRSEAQFRAMAENMREMVVRLSAEGRILYASPSHLSGLGYPPEQLLGRAGTDFVHEDDRQRMLSAFDDLESSDDRGLMEFRLVHRDGHPVWVESSQTILCDEAGHCTGLLMVLRDIGERRELEDLRLESERLSVSLQKEQELSSLKSRMMTRISHEFRTPLANIQVTSDLLLRYFDRLTVEQREARLHSIQPQVQQITNMLDSISSVINPPRLLDFEQVTLAATCEQLLHELREPLAKREAVTLAIQPITAAVLADRDMMVQMTRSLLLNAMQFSPAHTPILIEVQEYDQHVTIVVQDSGIGIPDEDLPRVFEPFFRGSNVGEVSGLGLGLSIAQAIVEAHGGTITIQSRLDRGTQVNIVLPKFPTRNDESIALIS